MDLESLLKNLNLNSNHPLLKNIKNNNFNYLKELNENIDFAKLTEDDKILLFLFLFSNKIFKNLRKKRDVNFSSLIKFFDENLENYIKYTENNEKIITRFPPEPSGYLHIGHIKALLINYNKYLSTKNNENKFYVRFDNTNPKNIQKYKKFIPIILEDLKSVGIENFQLTRTTDYFEKIKDFGLKLLKEGHAYCDNTPKDRLRMERDEGIKSSMRDNLAEKNLEIFKNKTSGYCVRVKLDYANKNKCLRDPVIYRLGEDGEWFPTYDFACPIVDSLEGITICFRTIEYLDRNAMYKQILKLCELPDIKIQEFSRLNFENTILSKRKIQRLIDNNLITSWSDPRLPTLRGILRLGVNIDVLKEYINLQNANIKNSICSWDKLFAMNKKKIDKTSKRISAIFSDNINITIEGDHITFENQLRDISINSVLKYENDIFEYEQYFYNRDRTMGTKKVYFDHNNIAISKLDYDLIANGDKVTLMGVGNFIINFKKNKKIFIPDFSNTDYKSTNHKINFVNLQKNADY